MERNTCLLFRALVLLSVARAQQYLDLSVSRPVVDRHLFSAICPSHPLAITPLNQSVGAARLAR